MFLELENKQFKKKKLVFFYSVMHVCCKVTHVHVRTRLLWLLLDLQNRGQQVASGFTSLTPNKSFYWET